LLGTPITWFVLVVIAALALTAEREPAGAPAGPSRAARPVAPTGPPASQSPAGLGSRVNAATTLLCAAGLLISVGVFAFSLRAEALNEAGLALAAQGEWAAAAEAFEQAAARDPGLSLYTQSAAYARTQAGDLAQARSGWEQAARDDPYWAVLPATVAVLDGDPARMRPALALAGQSHLLHLNAGALAEAAGDNAAARAAYDRALSLRPASALALYWQQTPLRQSALAAWQAARPADTSPQGAGLRALAQGAASEAAAHFERALAANPGSNLAYWGLARAALDLGQTERAGALIEAGLRLPFAAVEDTLPLRLLRGDWALAAGEPALARAAYAEVFSAVSDYTVLGPGTYGYPQRSWYVYHRPALPSDLVPQFARADLTAEMDARFAELAGWLAAGGQPDTACAIAVRVTREAPESVSGRWAAEHCAGFAP
jgi:tetratricopeptide (TPR) repeat protein